MSDQENPYSGGGNPYSTGGTMGGSASYGGAASQGAPAAPASPAPVADDGLISTAADPVVKDITTESFMTDVLDASKDRPVIVDFWAPWCGPCKTLGPVIEKVVTEAKGAVTLAKMDIEKYPDVAQQMGIQSIPAVVAFVDGRPADAFMGAKPESEVKAFVDKVAKAKPTPEAQGMADALAEADRLASEKDYGGASELYGAILQREPGNLDALAGLGQCYVAVGETEQAQMLVDTVPEEHRKDGALAALVKTLELSSQAEGLGDLEPLAKAVEDDPKNHQARFDYAVALNGAGKREEAADQLIAIVKADRSWNEDGARTQLLEFFEAWGNMDPATIAGRRALSSVLFS